MHSKKNIQEMESRKVNLVKQTSPFQASISKLLNTLHERFDGSLHRTFENRMFTTIWKVLGHCRRRFTRPPRRTDFPAFLRSAEHSIPNSYPHEHCLTPKKRQIKMQSDGLKSLQTAERLHTDHKKIPDPLALIGNKRSIKWNQMLMNLSRTDNYVKIYTSR